MIQVDGVVIADAANVLVGTDLASAPGPGVLEVYIASSQADTIVNISAPPNIPGRAIRPALRANGLPQLSDMSPYSVGLAGGEQITVAVDIVTGATVGYCIRFTPEDEL